MKARRSGPKVAVLAVGIAALLASSCASKPTSGGGGYPSYSPSAPAATPSLAGSGGGYGHGGGGYGDGGGSTSTPPAGPVSATVKQGVGGAFVFSPKKLTVKQGDTIAIDNVSSFSHTFTVQGQSIDVVNNGGQNQTVTISLAPGTYTFVCRFHQSLGMTGTLIVTG